MDHYDDDGDTIASGTIVHCCSLSFCFCILYLAVDDAIHRRGGEVNTSDLHGMVRLHFSDMGRSREIENDVEYS
jgi:hypothetical protein